MSLDRDWGVGSQKPVPWTSGGSRKQNHKWPEVPNLLAHVPCPIALHLQNPNSKIKFFKNLKTTTTRQYTPGTKPSSEHEALCILHWSHAQAWAAVCDNTCLPEGRAFSGRRKNIYLQGETPSYQTLCHPGRLVLQEGSDTNDPYDNSFRQETRPGRSGTEDLIFLFLVYLICLLIQPTNMHFLEFYNLLISLLVYTDSVKAMYGFLLTEPHFEHNAIIFPIVPDIFGQITQCLLNTK